MEVPPPLVAELLGYSYNVTQRHAEIAARPWARYVKAIERTANTEITHNRLPSPDKYPARTRL